MLFVLYVLMMEHFLIINRFISYHPYYKLRRELSLAHFPSFINIWWFT